MFKKNLYILLFMYSCSLYSHATSIKGQVKIDNSWEPLIYLSVINSFDDLNTASYDFLIARAEIDSLGNFEMNGLEIPNGERIYRLHICKKGDPVSTIIIGGKNENFIHFIMQNGDSVRVKINPRAPSFYNSTIEGHAANKSLSKLFKLRKNLNSPPELPSNQNRQFLRTQVLESFYTIADTSSYAIIQLITAYFVNESFASSGQLDFMEKVYAKVQVSDTSSPYYRIFLDELTYMKYQAGNHSKNKYIGIISIILLAVTGSILAWIFISRKKISANTGTDFSRLINQLSVQEKRVLDLLKEGRSNKEISQELHIEVSTVKSHLNKIYSRLGVNGRKEIINSEW